MKKILLLFLITIPLLTFFQSCDKVNAPFREDLNVDTSCSFAPLVGGANRKVLLEEFTGHLCGNCPPTTVYISDTIKPRYADSLVVITIHAKYFAETCPISQACPGTVPPGSFTKDYRCDVSEKWYEFFNTAAVNPICMVNRFGFPTSSHLKSKSQLAGLINSQLLTTATARLRIQNTFDESTRKLSSCIESKFLAYLNGTYKLQVVLTEDSIIDWQLWYGHTPDEAVQDFVFHHVLRGTMNSNFGTSLVSGTIAPDSTVNSGFFYDIPADWNADQVYVVAFIYNDNTKEVIQVEEAKIK
jgi:hypothetical protein